MSKKLFLIQSKVNIFHQIQPNHVSGAHVWDPDPAELLLHLPGGRQPRHLRRQGGEALLLLGHQQTVQSGRIARS